MDRRVIRRGMSALAEIDADVAGAVELFGLPAPRLRPAGFEALFSIIVSQQISTEAARAILRRVTELSSRLSTESLLRLDVEALRNAGMSYRKIDYARGLAQAVVDGRLDVEGLAQRTDEEVVAALTALHGFGRWSAEIYLMFSLRRRDVFPADDLALQVALGRLKGLAARPTPGETRRLVAHWAPWRSVGALFLWHYYRGAPA